VIGGKIEKWFVKEGQLVHKGDTILQLSEIRSEYFNPNLVDNAKQQLDAKGSSVKSYVQKLEAIDDQINAMIANRKLKMEQAENKLIQSRLKFRNDSIELKAVKLNEQVAAEQLARMEKLYQEGLKSLTDLEARRIKSQEFQVKVQAQQNKMAVSKNEVLNASIEIDQINAEFREKISKLESDKGSTLSGMYDAEAAVTKLQNDVVNYSIRSGLYFVLAPQDGFISKAVQSGIGENIKEGTDIVSIVPLKNELAVEIFVYPMDVPLLNIGQKVNIQFDGWPAIVFSGWPGASYGTYRATIVAIDNNISENGKYRVVAKKDDTRQPWPAEIKLGAGAQAFALLKEVPIWYELWRKINGFPPDYYKQSNEKNEKKK
jgi:multidrug efflux pump subunit AcrA (membrane-fusion protein)